MEKLPKLPLRLTIQIDATNGTSTLKAVNIIVDQLISYHFPKKGQIFRDKEFPGCSNWKVKILDSIATLKASSN